MGNQDQETIELESQPLNTDNTEKKTEIINQSKNEKKQKIRPIGLTKEELMKYAKDPFWCKLRKVLFYLFWILWLSMFVGAFLIIHLVPTCPSISRLKWYQKQPVGQINFEIFNYKFNDVSKNIDSFMSVFQTKTLLLPNLFKSSQINGGEGDEIVDHLELNTDFGSQEELSKMLKDLKIQHQTSVLMDFNAAVTSRNHEWFKLFVNRTGKYINYYLVDNNFDGLINYNSEMTSNSRKVITKLGKPVLNLLNPDVRAEFKSIFEKWGRLNIKGFRLLGGPYVVQDPDTKRAVKSIELTRKLIKEWSKEFKHAVSDGLIILQLDEQDAHTYGEYYGSQEEPIADIVVNKVLSKLDIRNSTKDIKDKLEQHINSKKSWNDELMNIGPWTGWLVDDYNESREKDDLIICFSNILGYILPRGMPLTLYHAFNLLHIGTPTSFHRTLKQEFNEPNKYGTFDNARIFAKLSNLRNDYADAIMLGKTEFINVKVNNQLTDDVFAMIRTNDKQGIILIANLKNGSKNVTLDIDFDKYPRTANVRASCKIKEGFKIGETIQIDQPISLKLNETFVASFSTIL